MRWLAAGALLAVNACGSCAERQSPQPPPVRFDGASAVDAAANNAHGERLTYVLGCRGCHGDQLSGEQFATDHPEYGPIYASNLTRLVPRYSDAQLDQIIRAGKHPERRVVWSMPSEMFHALSNDDMSALIAHLRTLRPQGQATPPPKFSTLDRKDIASGQYKPAPDMVADAIKRPPLDLGSGHGLGRYIAMTACTECHGSNLGGRPNDTPDLIVAGAYSREEFEKLMTTGVPIGGRKLRMMDGVARGRFSHLTRHERDELYAYLKARAEAASD